MAVVSLVLALWQPISTLLSGFIIGFLFAAGLAYISLRVYLSARANETVTHEWLTFPDLESMLQEKVVKPARQPSPPVRTRGSANGCWATARLLSRHAWKSCSVGTMPIATKNSFGIRR